ncbi:MAG: FAD-dependent oxidoreductase [Candidatus Krumholzibacteria bacterium]|nr:FAD-dependent oxidoreductase [Candidatus Krumholzibacteria bacterium]
MLTDAQKSDFVIIGGVAAGPKTAATLARRVPNASITLFQREEHLSYATCGFPFFASGEVNSFEELLKTSFGVVRDAEFFRNVKGFSAITSAEVTRIDRKKKTITAKLLETGETVEHGYGRLVIATGATPTRAPMPVPDSSRVRPFTRPADVIDFRQSAQRGEIESAVIVGGGFIGVELCEAVKDMWGIEATLFEKQSQLLPYMLDKEMAAIVQRSMVSEGVDVVTDADVVEIQLDAEGKPVVSVRGRKPLSTDYVFLCLGVQPEVSLARDCGLDIGETGGIRVDQFLRTNDADIFAGGDCIESRHAITGKPCYLSMGSLANRHGRVIAENLAGGTTVYPGVLGAFVLRAFEIHIGGVGLSEQPARDAGFQVRSVWGSFSDRPDYNPEVKTLSLKMLYEEGTNRLLGLQAVGKGDICRRVDVFSSLLRRGALVDDLFDFEHGYAPPFAEALDPLHHMAGIAAAGQRNVTFVSPDIVSVSIGKDDVLLDVRETEEANAELLPIPLSETSEKIVVIPLTELRDRVGELDRDRRVLVICRRGMRAYHAALILQAAGFERIEILAAGLLAQW